MNQKLESFIIMLNLPEWDIEDAKIYRDLKSQLELELTKAIRYDELQNRYSNGTEKYFDELCGLYFDDEKLTVQQESNCK